MSDSVFEEETRKVVPVALHTALAWKITEGLYKFI
jgi:hypothetical protein